MTGKRSKTEETLSFELKYCERCGGLWLRPAGGEQIYCVDCGRDMAELPAASCKVKTTKMPAGPQWGGGSELEEFEEEKVFEEEEMGQRAAGGGE
jgi:hypothetical protein